MYWASSDLTDVGMQGATFGDGWNTGISPPSRGSKPKIHSIPIICDFAVRFLVILIPWSSILWKFVGNILWQHPEFVYFIFNTDFWTPQHPGIFLNLTPILCFAVTQELNATRTWICLIRNERMFYSRGTRFSELMWHTSIHTYIRSTRYVVCPLRTLLRITLRYTNREPMSDSAVPTGP